MKRIFPLIILLSLSLCTWGQLRRHDFSCAFENLVNEVVNTEKYIKNYEKIYKDLRDLRDNVNDEIRALDSSEYSTLDDTSKTEELTQLKLLESDIKTIMSFLTLFSNQSPLHLSDNQIFRLSTIFGQYFRIGKLKFQSPIKDKEDIEFVEVSIGLLKICYLHCISKKDIHGVQVKYYASYNNFEGYGTLGALVNEYTPIYHNVEKQYLILRSASIRERF